jgi:hypothetical protein
MQEQQEKIDAENQQAWWRKCYPANAEKRDDKHLVFCCKPTGQNQYILQRVPDCRRKLALANAVQQ